MNWSKAIKNINGNYWETFEILRLNFLKIKSDDNSSNISRTEWNAYFDWHFEASQCYQESKIASLQNRISRFSSVQFSCSVVYSLRPHESHTPGLPVHHQLQEFTQTHVHQVSDAIQPSHPLMPSSHLILCCPLFLLPPIPPSIRVFSSESTLCMRWRKYWSFSFSIIPS